MQKLIKSSISILVFLTVLSSIEINLFTTTDESPKISEKHYFNSSHISTFSTAENSALIHWNATFGGSGDDIGYCIKQTNDDGFIIIGSTTSNTKGQTDVLLVKLNRDGSVLWSKTFGGPGSDEGRSILVTSDGYYLVGSTDSYGTGDSDIWVIKTDERGDIIQNKTIGGAGADTVSQVIESSDNLGQIMVGTTYRNNKANIWVIKEGRNPWNKTYSNIGDCVGTSIHKTINGYIVLGTETYLNGSSRLLVLNIDNSGNIRWSKTFGGIGNYYGSSVEQTIEGNYLITGSYIHEQISDIFLLKITSRGNVLWQKTYGGVDADEGYCVKQASNGYLIMGMTSSYGPNEPGNMNIWLLKTDSNGVEQWNATFGGIYDDFGTSMILDWHNDSNYILTGYTKSFGAQGADIWIIHTTDPPTIPIPEIPTGPRTMYTGQQGTYTTYAASSADSEMFSYQFSWGDGTYSEWTLYVSSGIPVSGIKMWNNPGSYQVKTRTKDINNHESKWSEPLLVIVSDKTLPKKLDISVNPPTGIIEQTSFYVLITADGLPVEQAMITFAGNIYRTASNGIAELTAPSIEDNTLFTLSASYPGYKTGSTTILVIAKHQATTNAWIFGLISSATNGAPIQGATICISPNDLEQEKTKRCTITDSYGQYYFVVIPDVDYSITVEKFGYETIQNRIIVLPNQAVEYSASLKLLNTPNSISSSQEALEKVISLQIETGKIGGQILLEPHAQDIQIYNDAIRITSLDYAPGESYSFHVHAEEGTPVSVFAIRVSPGTLDLSSVSINVDGEDIEYVGFNELFDTEQAPTWTMIKTYDSKGLETGYVLIKICFSEHVVTIFSYVQKVIEWLTLPLAIGIYVLVCFLGISAFLYPFLAWPPKIQKGKKL
ncbi:MAG: carboxypeptidase-like regulatory domain-containing protein [Candidatus Thermoplasmatota archaeon]